MKHENPDFYVDIYVGLSSKLYGSNHMYEYVNIF